MTREAAQTDEEGMAVEVEEAVGSVEVLEEGLVAAEWVVNP